jgi:hypothetical protein
MQRLIWIGIIQLQEESSKSLNTSLTPSPVKGLHTLPLNRAKNLAVRTTLREKNRSIVFVVYSCTRTSHARWASKRVGPGP